MRPPLLEGPYLVVGLARSGVAVCRALCGVVPDARIVACDIGHPAEAIEATAELSELGVGVHLGTDGVELLDANPELQCVVKSPGVSQGAPVIAAARRRGLTVTGELEIAWRLLSNPFCAVTGTNGKTTTVALIGAMLRAAGQPHVVAGNVGLAVASLVGRIDPEAVVVCETSSFQLEDAIAFKPCLSVFLNFAADHLDRHGTIDGYLRAKLGVFANQREGDVALMNAREPLLNDVELPSGVERIYYAAGVVGGDRDLEIYERDDAVWWRGTELIAVEEIRLRGTHNLENAMAAAGAALTLGAPTEAVAATLREFSGVEHRLEEICEHRGVLFVDDSKATNVASARVAIEAFNSGVHLILGGSSKGSDFGALREPVSRHCSAVYLIGAAAERIASDLGDIGPRVNECNDLERAVSEAAAAAASGEVVLLSPACASLDQYDNYEERGDHFHRIVQQLETHR